MQLAEAGEALAHAGPETFWALLGRDGQLNGLFQSLVSGRPCQQQLSKLIGTQLGQSRIVILRFSGMVQFAASHVRWLSAILYRYF